jgi:hypothetical protein
VPPNGLLIRFQRIVRPTLSSFSDAPMTATVFGAKIASSDEAGLFDASWVGFTAFMIGLAASGNESFNALTATAGA